MKKLELKYLLNWLQKHRNLSEETAMAHLKKLKALGFIYFDEEFVYGYNLDTTK